MICSRVLYVVTFFLHVIASTLALIAVIMPVEADYGKCSYSYFKPWKYTRVAVLLLVAGAIIVTINMIYSFCSKKVWWYLTLLAVMYWMICWIPILFLWLGVSPQSEKDDRSELMTYKHCVRTRKGLFKAGVVLAIVSGVVSHMWYRAYIRTEDGWQHPNGENNVKTRDTRFFNQV